MKNTDIERQFSEESLEKYPYLSQQEQERFLAELAWRYNTLIRKRQVYRDLYTSRAKNQHYDVSAQNELSRLNVQIPTLSIAYYDLATVCLARKHQVLPDWQISECEHALIDKLIQMTRNDTARVELIERRNDLSHLRNTTCLTRSAKRRTGKEILHKLQPEIENLNEHHSKLATQPTLSQLGKEIGFDCKKLKIYHEDIDHYFNLQSISLFTPRSEREFTSL